MSESDLKTLPCGCVVETKRDFLGRVVGTITAPDERCDKQHASGQVVIMPGRENARPE